MQRLSRTELIELVEKLLSNEGTEQQDIMWLDLVCRNVPDPGVIDLIQMELPAEEIVDRALSYQPVLLGPSSQESTKRT